MILVVYRLKAEHPRLRAKEDPATTFFNHYNIYRFKGIGL